MSGEHWARHASWYQRRYSPVARMAEAFEERVRVDTDFMTKHRPNPDPNDDFRTRRFGTPTNPPKETMNDSLKLALKLNLTTWKTVTALLTSGKPAELNDVAKANIESLNLLLKAEEEG